MTDQGKRDETSATRVTAEPPLVKYRILIALVIAFFLPVIGPSQEARP